MKYLAAIALVSAVATAACARPTPSTSVIPPPTSAPSSAAAASAALSPVGPAASGYYRGPIYAQLPSRTQGEWSARVLLDGGDILLTSGPAGPNEDAAKFVSEVVRFNSSSKALTPLLQLAPGMQVIQPRAVKDTLAWIEGPQDLRAFGWKIHVTDIHSAQDRVVASDSGVHAISNSVLPAIALTDGRLAYTSLEQGTNGPEWRLHSLALADGRDVVIASLTNPRDARFLSLWIDAQTLAWSENVVGQDPHTNVGVFDIAGSRILFRGRTVISAAYQIVAWRDDLFFATQDGLLRSDRAVTRPPVPISPEKAPVDTLTVVGDTVLYNNFDQGNTLAAIDLRTGEHSRIATNVTRGPVSYGHQVFWFEKATSGLPARAAVLDLNGQP